MTVKTVAKKKTHEKVKEELLNFFRENCYEEIIKTQHTKVI